MQTALQLLTFCNRFYGLCKKCVYVLYMNLYEGDLVLWSSYHITSSLLTFSHDCYICQDYHTCISMFFFPWEVLYKILVNHNVWMLVWPSKQVRRLQSPIWHGLSKPIIAEGERMLCCSLHKLFSSTRWWWPSWKYSFLPKHCQVNARRLEFYVST